MRANDIDRPIFFVGMPRSGTTVIFLQWRRVVESTRDESARFAPDRYAELSYERFVAERMSSSTSWRRSAGFLARQRRTSSSSDGSSSGT